MAIKIESLYEADKVPDDLKEDYPLSANPIQGLKHLEGITAKEKALAVPYVKIWEIDQTTSAPVNPNNPLSLKFVSPPKFGKSVLSEESLTFRERPDVSLEKVSVKLQAAKETIFWREVTINITVHRPDALFENDTSEHDNFSALLIPGRKFEMEYGWSSNGAKNPILTGEKIRETDSGYDITVKGTENIRFTITNYNFSLGVNAELRLTVKAIEDAEDSLRNTTMFPGVIKDFIDKNSKKIYPELFSEIKNKSEGKQFNSLTDEQKKEILRPIAQKSLDIGSELFYEIQNKLVNKYNVLYDESVKQKGFVTFRDILKHLFLESLDDTLKLSGYVNNVILLGNFNDNAGVSSEKYGSVDLGKKSIGEFKFHIDEVYDIVEKSENLGENLKTYSFLKHFLNIIEKSHIWLDKSKNVTPDSPKLRLQKIYGRNKKNCYIMIFDARKEWSQLLDSKKDKLNYNSTRSQIRDYLKEKNVPYISFMKGNSYIKDCAFNVIQDDKINSIFIQRSLRYARKDITEFAQSQLRSSRASDGTNIGRQITLEHLMYSSSITGNITMLGNFVFSRFGYCWIDFGVKLWSGPFFIMSREETISAGDFSTKVEFVPAGGDPLGVQGHSLVRESIDIVKNLDNAKLALKKKRK